MMRRTITCLTLGIAAFSANAQFGYFSPQQTDEIVSSIMDMVGDYVEKNKLATLSVYPSGDDTFFALVSFWGMNYRNLVITYGDPLLPDYFFLNGLTPISGNIITPSIFLPGQTITLKDESKTWTTITIPEKGSMKYDLFVRNGYESAARITGGGLNNYNSYPGSGSFDSPSCVYETTCSMCNGKGWIAGSKSPNYGTGSYWCSDCQRTVLASHSHDRCPGCSGTGEVRKIR